MAKSIITRQVQTRQEYGLKPLDGLMMIGAFNARDGYYNLANGRPLTRVSAAVLRTAAPGVVAQQTAVNQGAWCPVALPSINAKYIALWHGVFVGAITGGSPTLVGIANSTGSQQAGPINIIRETNDTITVAAKLGSTAASRTFSVSSSGWYGKTVTLIGFYEISTLTVQLLVYIDGQLNRYSSALYFSGDTAPTILGTEQFVVGTDVVENPTRSPNVQTALAACFCGSIPTIKLYEIAENPWQIFRPKRRVTYFDLGAGGAVSLTVADALHGHTADNLGLTTATGIVVADSLHAHAPDNVTLSAAGVANLSIANALHGHAAENVTIGLAGVASLQIADATHNHSADNIALTSAHRLTVFDATHDHTAENVTLDASNAAVLSIADSSHAHTSDSIVISADVYLLALDSLHAHRADNLILQQVGDVAYVRAPAGSGAALISASAFRPSQSAASRPSQTNTRRY